MNKKELEQELKDVSVKLDKWKNENQGARNRGQSIGNALIKEFPDPTDKEDSVEKSIFNTHLISPALAEIMSKCVHRKWSCGEYLGIEWALEHFWAAEVERHIPRLLEIHNLLEERNHTQKNPFTYNDMDYNIFYIKNDWIKNQKWIKDVEGEGIDYFKNIMVFDQQGYGQLVIHKKDYFHEKINAVRIWPRTTKRYGFTDKRSLNYYRNKKWKLEYGDCRDKGYILSYEKMFNNSKVDRAFNHFSEVSNWLWFVARTYENLKNPEEGQYD